MKPDMSAIAAKGCCVCHRFYGVHSPATIHHVRSYGGKRDLAPVIPLCHLHHQGEQGIHHLGKKAWERIYGEQESYL
jgi:hypothetical protein